MVTSTLIFTMRAARRVGNPVSAWRLASRLRHGAPPGGVLVLLRNTRGQPALAVPVAKAA